MGCPGHCRTPEGFVILHPEQKMQMASPSLDKHSCPDHRCPAAQEPNTGRQLSLSFSVPSALVVSLTCGRKGSFTASGDGSSGTSKEGVL